MAPAPQTRMRAAIASASRQEGGQAPLAPGGLCLLAFALVDNPGERVEDQPLADNDEGDDPQADRNDTVDGAEILRQLHQVTDAGMRAEQLRDQADLPADPVGDADGSHDEGAEQRQFDAPE